MVVPKLCPTQSGYSETIGQYGKCSHTTSKLLVIFGSTWVI